jgi:nitrogen fixation protein NifQ
MTDRATRLHADLLAAAGTTGDPADAHVFAAVLALAVAEAESSGGLPAEGLGLTPGELGALIDNLFPTASRAPFRLDRHDLRPAEEEEEMLRALLDGERHPSDVAGGWLATIVARRAMRPDHLWQDLGLANRGELNALISRHFPALHAGNVANMRWKKYFYRRLCEAEGFALCTAPSCGVCRDFADCFGEETGLSRLARNRLGTEKTV